MNILITGMSGSGKSTIATKLQARGYHAYDTDNLNNLSAWVERATGKPNPNFSRTSAEDWVEKYDWLWDEKRLRELLNKSNDKTVYFCGSSANQEEFYPLFDMVILLEVDDQLLIERLTKSKREHDFGSRPGEIEVILGWYKDFQKRTKSSGALVVDARQPIDKVVEEILSLTADSVPA